MKLLLNSLHYEVTSHHVEMAAIYQADILSRMRNIDRDDRNIASQISDIDLMRSCWSSISEESDILDEEGLLCLVAVLMASEGVSERLCQAIEDNADMGVILDLDRHTPILYDPSSQFSVDLMLDSSLMRFKVNPSKVALALSVILASGRPDYRSHHSMVFFHAGRLSAFSKMSERDSCEEAAKILLVCHVLLCQTVDFTFDAISEFFELGRCELALGRNPGEVTRLSSELLLPPGCLMTPTQKGIH